VDIEFIRSHPRSPDIHLRSEQT